MELTSRTLADSSPTTQVDQAPALPHGAPEPTLPAQSPRREVLAGEGNVTEVPLFVLNNKAAKVRGVDPADREALARAYTRRIVRPASLPDGRVIQRTVTVISNPVFGNPTDLAQRIFHILVARWEGQERPDDPRVYLTRADLCRDLGVKVSGREFRRIEHQLRALKAVSVEFVDAWYEKPDARERGRWAPGKKTVSIIADWSFEAEPLGADVRGAGGDDASAWIKLGEAVHASLRSRYLQPLDLAYFLALDAVSRRLYVYLNKRANHDKATYSERLALLRERMPLDGDRPSRVVGPLRVALDRLTAPLDVGRRSVRFLDGYQWPFEGEGWDQVVHVWFHGRSHLEGLQALKARLGAAGAAPSRGPAAAPGPGGNDAGPARDEPGA